MEIELSPIEIRIIGCLIEKEFTTPESYPLSLNALQNACNQKSNRHPIMKLNEVDVIENIDALVSKHLVREKNVSGSRVSKYAHRLSNTLTGKLDFNPKQLACLCVLFVRGSQTVGEIRTRTSRMCDFTSLSDVEAMLNELTVKDSGPYVKELPRQVGRREKRYVHLFGGDVDVSSMSDIILEEVDVSDHKDQSGRIIKLEEKMEDLVLEVSELKKMFESLTDKLEPTL